MIACHQKVTFTMEKIIVALVVTLTVAGWFILRDYRDHSQAESRDCRRYCEWQVSQMTDTFTTLKVQMNETCKTLIAAYEDKLRQLHGSDMDMALTREQWQKEFVALIQYEFQSFQRYYSSKVDESASSQFCTSYCSSLEKQLRQCKDNSTFLWSNSLHMNQGLKYRERRLRYHLRDNLQRIQSALASAALSRRTTVVALFFLIFLKILVIGLILYYHHWSYVRGVITEKIKLQAGKREKLIKNSSRNLDRFWQERFSKVREAETKLNQELDESQSHIRSLKEQVSSLKMHELKQKRQLTSEIFASHKRIIKLETDLQQKSDDLTTRKQLILAETVEELEDTIRELEQEIKRLEIALTTEKEKAEFACLVEKERAFREQQRFSRLEQHNIALKKQASRLEEGLLAKVSKSSKRRQLLPSVLLKDEACQTMDCSENAIDLRLADIRREFETRFNDLQRKVKDDRAKETEQLKSLKGEHDELRTKLEVANKRCTYLEDLVSKTPSQSQILMCNIGGLKLHKGHGRSREKLKSLNLIAGLQKVDAHFLTPPFVNDFLPDDSLENYLSVQ